MIILNRLSGDTSNILLDNLLWWPCWVLKLQVSQSHRKWHGSIENVLPVNVLYSCCGILAENWEFSPPHHYFRPPSGLTSLEFLNTARAGKLDWWGYQTVNKIWRFVQPFRYIHKCDGQTDGQTPVDSFA